MSLKQKIDDHPVIVYMSAIIISFAAGFAAYDTLVRISGRSIAKPADLEKVAKYDALSSELASLKSQPGAGSTLNQMKIEFVDSVQSPSLGCPGKGNVLVKERYTLESDVDTRSVLIVHSDNHGEFYALKSDTGTVFFTDPNPNRRGWIYQYCASSPWTATYRVRFFNLFTGSVSGPITAKIDI